MSRRGDRRVIPFGVHQALDYLLGLFIALNAVHIAPTAAALALGLGGALVLLPMVSDGPLGGWRLLSPATHRVGDFLIVAVAATSPWLFHSGWDLTSLLLPLTTAFLVAAVCVATSYERPPPKTSATRPAPVKHVRSGARRVRAAPKSVRDLGKVVGKVQSEGPRALGRAVGRVKKDHR